MYAENKEYDNLTKEVRELVGSLISTLMINKRTSMDSTIAGDTLMLNILLNIERVFTYSLDAPMAVGVDGLEVKMLVNPYYLMMITSEPKHVLNIVLHECYHLLFEHLTEFCWVFGDKDKQKLMNIATDCQINQYLKGLPKNAVTLTYVEDLVGEDLETFMGSLYYYEKLIDKINTEKVQEVLNIGGGETEDEITSNIIKGKVIDDHSVWKEGKGKEEILQHVVENIVENAYKQLTERQRGSLPGHLQEIVSRLHKEKSVNWKAIIKRGIGTLPVPYKYSKKKMNRRFPERMDLSGKMIDRFVNINVFLDTSGSMSTEDIGYALSEIYHMMKDIGGNVIVVQVDTKVVGVSILNKRKLKDFKANGRGGTLFQPAFDWLKENNYTNKNSISIYFTDGYGEGEWSIDRYGYKNMYWVLTGEDANIEDLSCEGKGKVALLREDVKYNRLKKG